MNRWTYRYRIVQGEPATTMRRVREDLPALLSAAVGEPPAPPAGDGSHLIGLHAELLGTTIGKQVRVDIGVAGHDPERLVIPISWRADPMEHAFPTFDGTIEVEPLSAHAAQLTIVGRTAMPAGQLGAVLDAAGLRRVGDRVIDGVVEGIAAALSGPPLPGARLDPMPMRVRDVMTPEPATLHESDQLRTAARLLFNRRIGGAPVVDDDGLLLGVLSETDLLQTEASPERGLRWQRSPHDARRLRPATTVGEACSRPARTTGPTSSLHDAGREMLRHDVSRLVVVDAATVVGIVTRHDVLRSLLRTDDVIVADATAILAGADQPGAVATSDWGTVTLTGEISRLSELGDLVDRVDAVDGVVAVDRSALGWILDDVTYVPMV